MAPALSSGGLTIHVPETLGSPVLSPRSPSGLHVLRALFQALLPVPATSTGRGGRAGATACLLLQSGTVARDQPRTDSQGAGNSRWVKNNRCFTWSRFLSGPRRACPQLAGFDSAEQHRRGARPRRAGHPCPRRVGEGGPGRATGRGADHLRSQSPARAVRHTTARPPPSPHREPHGGNRTAHASAWCIHRRERTPLRNKCHLQETILPRGHQATQPGA